MKKLLIVGLDPGTTAAYALLDWNGNLIATHSAKNKGISYFITEITKHGIPVVTATDVHPAPHFVQEFHRKMGTTLIAPSYDLGVAEKKEYHQDLKLPNIHEGDAYAAARYAYKKVKPLIDHVDNYIEKNEFENPDEIRKRVIAQGMTPLAAARAIEEKPKYIPPIVQKPEVNVEKLQEKMTLLKKELAKSKIHRHMLENELRKIQKQIKHSDQPKVEATPNQQKQQIYFKEQRVIMFQKMLKSMRSQYEQLESERNMLIQFLTEKNDFIIAKKLKSLTHESIDNRKKYFTIKENDTIIVDDIHAHSRQILEELKDKNITIIYKGKVSPTAASIIPGILISAEALRIEDAGFIARIPKADIEQHMNREELLQKIVEDYKHERAITARESAHHIS